MAEALPSNAVDEGNGSKTSKEVQDPKAVRGPLVKNELALPDWLAACPMAEAQGDMPGKQALLRKEVTQAQEDADMEKKQQREEKKQQAKAKAKAKPKAKGRKSKTAQPAGESHEPQPSQPCSAKRPEPEPTHPETSNTEPQPKASDKKRKTTAAQKPDPSAHVAQQEEQQQQQPATSIKRSAESARSANKRAKVEVDGKSNEPPPTEDAMEEKDMAEIQQSTKKVEAGEARTVKARLGYTELFTNKIPDLPFPEGSFTRKSFTARPPAGTNGTSVGVVLYQRSFYVHFATDPTTWPKSISHLKVDRKGGCSIGWQADPHTAWEAAKIVAGWRAKANDDGDADDLE
ncbi:unnamed protein product [Effrenium voratum]|nr:unnamed protein product [Effrenium voratum]